MDDEAATRPLLQLPDAEFGNVPKDVHLNQADYLRYLVDHEVYHCLHARCVGPQPMSMRDLWAEYQHYLNEKGADAYAMAMHLREQGERTRFAENVLRIRSLSLYTLDPDHFTCDALQQVMNKPVAEVAALDPQGAFDLAVDARDRLDPGYEGYLQYLGSAIEAMDRLGIAENLDPQLRDHAGKLTVDEALVQRLVARTRECMRTLQLSQ